MKKVLALMSIALLLLQALPATSQSPPKSFATWCQQRASVPIATRHTIDVLLEQAGTQDCQQAASKLSRDNYLSIYRNQISDVKPLASLTKLKMLYLNNNKITDVNPLTSLTNLRLLLLNANQINDVKPLASLTRLKELDLGGNQISDVKPLANLTALRRLFINGNNQITEKDCPVKRKICKSDRPSFDWR